MIDVQKAVQIAVEYCGKLFGNVLNQLRLEEVELSRDDKHWLITVGFNEPLPVQTENISDMIHGYLQRPVERKYKVVDIDAETGKVRAVKMRSPLERVS